jgi:hypothetical protein
VQRIAGALPWLRMSAHSSERVQACPLGHLAPAASCRPGPLRPPQLLQAGTAPGPPLLHSTSRSWRGLPGRCAVLELACAAAMVVPQAKPSKTASMTGDTQPRRKRRCSTRDAGDVVARAPHGEVASSGNLIGAHFTATMACDPSLPAKSHCDDADCGRTNTRKRMQSV